MSRVKTPVFVDCDNTMGLPHSEIDDGLTLLYLLGRPDIELVGVSATHGNGSAEQAYEQTVSLFERLGVDVPVYSGGDDASGALCAASRATGLTVLGLGALTNLHRTALEDPGFFQRLEQVVLMGGYVRPLRFLRREVHELNLSSDARAAWSVLTAPCRVTVMSAQFCLRARFGLGSLFTSSGPAWLRAYIRDWFGAFSRKFGSAGFYLWDLVPAAWVGELAWEGFNRPAPLVRLLSTARELSGGSLHYEGADGMDASQPGIIGLPEQRFSRRAFVRHCISLWNQGAGITI